MVAFYCTIIFTVLSKKLVRLSVIYIAVCKVPFSGFCLPSEKGKYAI